MIKNKKIYFLFLILVLIIIVFFTLRFHFKSTNKKHNTIPTVKVEKLTLNTEEKTVAAYGTTVSPASAVIRAQGNAEIVSIDFQPDEQVKKGQLLFKLKVSDIPTQPQKLKKQMLLSKSWYDRLSTMNKKLPGSVSKFSLMKAKSQYMQDLAAYNEENSITNIKAPVGGVISNTNLAVGDFVNAGESLANIVTSDSLQIQYQLPSQDIGKIHLGQKVYFYPDGQNKSYLGKVTYISPQLNNSDYSVDIRANLANFSGLTPNYFGKVIQVVDKNYQTLSIPQGFVYTDAKGFYVYILKDNKVTTKYFKAGSLTQSGMLQVKSGLMPNELIITSDPSGLNVGQKVQVES